MRCLGILRYSVLLCCVSMSHIKTFTQVIEQVLKIGGCLSWSNCQIIRGLPFAAALVCRVSLRDA